MSLFDENAPSIGNRPKQHLESTFEYYNSSARRDIREIKATLEAWFQRVPEGARNDLRRRFRSPEDSQHRAALFELLVHELFTKIGYSLIFHPDVQGATHPDFLVKRGAEDLFYLEVTTAGASAEEIGEQRRIDQVYDSLNRLKNTDFYLAVFVRGAPETPPPGARLRRDLERWLATLDWRDIRARWDAGGFDALPFYDWEHDGWQVKFRPIPKSEEHRGEQALIPIGLTMPLEVQRLAPDEGIKKAIEVKNKYGVALPLIVAVNLMEDFCKEYDVMNALFGHETVVFTATGTKSGTRLRDGAWDGPHGPQNTSISAAMVFHDLQIWNAKQEARLWIVHNPWSARPLNSQLLPFRQYVPNKDAGVLQLIEGVTNVGVTLELPNPWPPEDEDEQ